LYHYLAHGLHIESQLACPELLPYECNGKPADVRIRFGDVPPELANPTGKGVLYQAKKNHFLLKLSDIARFLVQDGEKILIQPAPESRAMKMEFGSFCWARRWARCSISAGV